MPKMTPENYDAIRDHLFTRIHRNGEQMKNDFPNTLRWAIKTAAWKHYARPNGEPFQNLVEWLHCTFPYGTSMGQGQHVITYDDALKLTEGAPDVHQVLAENAPHPKAGRPKPTNGLSTSHFQRRQNRATSAAVLSVRLAQEYPKFYEAYMRGEYKTVTAAAIAAGLIKDANERRGKSAVRKMAPEQREQHLEWFWTEYPETFKARGFRKRTHARTRTV